MKNTYRVEVLEDCAVFTCNEDEKILEAMKRAGKGPIKHGCFGGGCGVCKMKIVSGDFKVIKNMSCAHVSQEDVEQGIVLICCVVPAGDLIISKQM
ncbi:2Fe-2S iron-sulfur cluster-binding protein [Lacrimispora brassicae]